MKNVCFIGSNGFLSSAFGRHFSNADVFGTSKPKKYQYKTFTEIDIISSEYQIEHFLLYDVIIVFSALGVQSQSKNDSDDVFEVNTFFPIKLFTFLTKNHFEGTIVTFGSYFEIGCNDRYRLFDEEEIIGSKCKVPNDYCLSKRLLTTYVNSAITKIKYWHFILPTLYGLGENSDRLIPYIISSITKNQEINLTSGEQVREYIDVDEVPKIIAKAMAYDLDVGIYNIPGQERISIRELTIKITNYFSYPIEKVKFGAAGRQDTDMLYLALNAKKLCNKLNYTSKGSFFENITKYLK